LDPEVDKFTFTLVLPIQYVSEKNEIGYSEDIAAEVEAYLHDFDLHVVAASLNLPISMVETKFCEAEASELPYILEHLYKPERLIYDWEGFQLLADHYECPAHFAHVCIEFTC
jgi:hypothetical protein